MKLITKFAYTFKLKTMYEITATQIEWLEGLADSIILEIQKAKITGVVCKGYILEKSEKITKEIKNLK